MIPWFAVFHTFEYGTPCRVRIYEVFAPRNIRANEHRENVRAAGRTQF